MIQYFIIIALCRGGVQILKNLNVNLLIHGQQQQLILDTNLNETFIKCHNNQTNIQLQFEDNSEYNCPVKCINDTSMNHLGLGINNSLQIKAFSICLTSQGGILELNEDKWNQNKQVSQEIELISGQQQYSLQTGSILYRQQQFIINKVFTIDSTDLYTYFDESTIAHFKQHLSSNSILIDEDICYIFSGITDDEFIKTFPTIYIQLGFIFEWQPQNYLFKKDSEHYCLTFKSTESNFRFGQSWMYNYETQFKEKSISFIKSECRIVDNNVSFSFSNMTWIQIIILIVIISLTIKCIIFSGLFIMSRMGGKLYDFKKKSKEMEFTEIQNDDNGVIDI